MPSHSAAIAFVRKYRAIQLAYAKAIKANKRGSRVTLPINTFNPRKKIGYRWPGALCTMRRKDKGYGCAARFPYRGRYVTASKFVRKGGRKLAPRKGRKAPRTAAQKAATRRLVALNRRRAREGY